MAEKISDIRTAEPASQVFGTDIGITTQGFPGTPVTRSPTELQRFDFIKTQMNAADPIAYTSGTATYSLNINSTNLKITGSDLNTIQDIDTTASPEFKQLSLNSSENTVNGAQVGLLIKEDPAQPVEFAMTAYGVGRTTGVANFQAGGTESVPTISGSTAFTFINAGHAYDGTTFLECVQIQGQIDGTPGVGDMPAKLMFCTRDQGAGGCSIRMTIKPNGNVGINTQAPDAVAILETSSTTKGVLFSPMTEAERDAVVTPPEGLEIFNLTSHKKNFFNGTVWVESDDLPVFTVNAVPFGKADGTLTEDASNFTFDNTMDQLAVGAPNTSITINGDTRSGSFLAASNGVPEKWGLIAQAFGTTTASIVTLTRARGSQVAPQASNAGDVLGGMCFAGYDGTDYGMSAQVVAVAAANHAAGDTPGYLVWSTTSSGDETPTEEMRLTDVGRLGLGETIPDDKLHVSDTSENARIRIENTGIVGNRNAGFIQKNSAHEVFTGVTGTSPTQWLVFSNTDSEPRISVDLDNKNVVISDSGALVTHNADILLDLQSSALAVKDPVLTTIARDALTGVEGLRIFNTTTKQFEGYNGTSWVVLG